MRYSAMWEVLSSKFSQPDLRTALLATDQALLVEGNSHGYQHWGDDFSSRYREEPGLNYLGLMLMRLRSSLRSDPAQTWPRVAVTGHRDLTPEQTGFVNTELGRVLRKLQVQHGAQTLIVGMAWGADLLAAQAAHSLGMPFWAYQPFPDQTSQWPASWAAEHARLGGLAQRTVVLGQSSVASDRRRAVALLHSRNRLMLRDADVLLAIHDRARRGGGTATTVGFTQTAGHHHRPGRPDDIPTPETGSLLRRYGY